MTKALLLRRKKLGHGSARGLSYASDKIDWVRNDRLDTIDINNYTHVIRWGCTSTIFRKHDGSLPTIINTAEAINRVNDKSGFRKLVSDHEFDIVPDTCFDFSYMHDYNFPVLVRPKMHSQGKHVYLCNNYQELDNVTTILGPGYYISDYIQKVAEYRVYMVQGKVVSIAQKNVEDPDAIAWNRSRTNCEFVNIRFDSWPISVADVATRAFSYSGLHFGGVDVMVDREGRAYVIEINSACSLPLLQGDGPLHTRISYRQKAMAKCLDWLIEGKDPHYEGGARYHEYIHAAMKDVGNNE